MDSYIVADRNLPWWLIGTSMVATTFSAETPLLVSDFVFQSGISKNWEWWCLLPGAMLTTFLVARPWRRTEVLTDAEYLTLRYSGPEAHMLRASRALYMGFIMNAIVLGSQLVVSGKFGTTLMGVQEGDPNYHLWRMAIAFVCAIVAVFFSSLAGIAALLLFPELGQFKDGGERAYILSINFVPAGLRGLVPTGFFSALMSRHALVPR